MWSLLSARASPARLLLRARRLRARLAGARGPARRSSSPFCRRIRAGGGSGGRIPGLVEFFVFFRRRRRWRPRQGGVAGTGGRSPRSFIDESSAAARRMGTAASLIGQRFPLQRQDGGWSSSSPVPATLKFSLLLDPFPLRILVLYFYCVLCTWFSVEYTWLKMQKKKKKYKPSCTRLRLELKRLSN